MLPTREVGEKNQDHVRHNVRLDDDAEASRAEQTNQITKAHRIFNSSTLLCFLELVCVRESGQHWK